MPSLTQQLADTVSTVGVHSAYGEPVEIDGTTILPVAMTSYGFGAGEADAHGDAVDGEGSGEGSGGGGGGCSAPLGAYLTRDGVTRFEPNTIALLAVGIPLVWVTGRALARLIRALKR